MNGNLPFDVRRMPQVAARVIHDDYPSFEVYQHSVRMRRFWRELPAWMCIAASVAFSVTWAVITCSR